jgi:hypothetical protein
MAVEVVVVSWLRKLLVVAVLWAVRVWQVASGDRDGWWYR